jgi:methionine--tRNA ligase beta chain
MDPITIDDFKKVEMRVGEVLSAEPVEGSEKLLKLRVLFGAATGGASPDDTEVRQVISGIAKFVEPASLVGKKFAFATNLAPRSIMGLESQAMILAVGGDGETPFAILEAPNAAPGSRVR